MINDSIHTLIQYSLPKRLLTLLCGWFADCKQIHLKNLIIQHFIHRYRVNMSEAMSPNPHDYPTFNDFFIRRLNPQARIMNPAPLISPVDGVISQIGQIHQDRLLQAKGRTYSLQQLLHDEKKAARFEKGQFATLYLAPKDYHRIHMPVEGRVRSMIYLPGQLFSVQPTTVRTIPYLFARNERVVVFFDTPMGDMAMVLVGATIVGRIATQWHGEFKRSRTVQHYDYSSQSIILKKGEEMGYFKLGSTVILILTPQAPCSWCPSLKENSAIRLYDRLGT